MGVVQVLGVADFVVVEFYEEVVCPFLNFVFVFLWELVVFFLEFSSDVVSVDCFVSNDELDDCSGVGKFCLPVEGEREVESGVEEEGFEEH